jgi:Fic family protein
LAKLRKISGKNEKLKIIPVTEDFPQTSRPYDMSNAVGYAWIQDALNVPDFLGTEKARLAAVNRLQKIAEGSLLVPTKLAPGGNYLEHALFAIRHEGVRLDYLAAALRQVSEESIAAEFAKTPNGTYIRKLCFLWEVFNQRKISAVAENSVSAAYVKMFDPAAYAVGESRRNARWRVDFNGLGELSFCPVVRKTDRLKQLLLHDVLAQAKAFADSIGPSTLERTLSWAYLSETEGSFAIEGETPSQDKASLFARLLKRAHDQRPLTEAYLVELQNAVITNPYDKAVQFRVEQNRLQGDALGAAGVTYVPPDPDLCDTLMQQVMALGNQTLPDLNPLVHAALVSFSFAFIHPFMDGNGRLSRFLIHHTLGQSGRLPAGFLLPISVAMKKHEDQYLQALKSFSKPARDMCQVLWSGDDHYSYTWPLGADIWFRYMDLTECAVFTLEMAQTALDTHLRNEVEFLAIFDDVARYINNRHDLRSSDLATLIVTTHQNNGKLSNKRRKRFADRVQAHVLDDIEAAVAKRMQGLPLGSPAH